MQKYNLSNFDADNLDGAPSGPLSQITIKVVNSIAAAQKIELFNYFRSIAKIYNANVTTSNPIAAWPNDAVTQATGLPITADRVYWNESGSLVIESAAGTQCVISGTTVPYRTLFEGSASIDFTVESLRFSFTTEPQLDEELVAFEKTIFGKYSENRVAPRVFFDPNQQQSKVVDMPITAKINGENGLEMNILAGETVSFALFVHRG